MYIQPIQSSRVETIILLCSHMASPRPQGRRDRDMGGQDSEVGSRDCDVVKDCERPDP